VATGSIDPAELAREVRSLLTSGASLGSYILLLRKFAQTGGTQDDARAVLEQIRADTIDVDSEDRILEALDVVEGFVSPSWKVW
jgi:hypothetical protein